MYTNLKVSSATIARTICLALALINQILSATGHAVLPIEDEQIETLVSLACTIAASVVAYWKNNSFTQAALKGDALMRSIKDRADY